MTRAPGATILLTVVSSMSMGLAFPTPARGEQWLVESRWRASGEVDDNVFLRADPAGTTLTSLLGGVIGMARQSESASTRMDIDLNLRNRSGAANETVGEGRFSLSHLLKAERDSLSVAASVAIDDTANAPVGNADALLGRGRRYSRSLSMGWGHLLSERLSTTVSATASATAYSASLPAATDFTQNALAGSVSYALDETSQATATLSRSDDRTAGGLPRSTSDSFRLEWSGSVGDSATATFGAGVFRSRRTSLRLLFVCPVAEVACLAGLEPFEVLRGRATTPSSGSTMGAGVEIRADEVTSLSMRMARELASGGAGVQRNDTVSAGARREWGPRLASTLSVGLTKPSALGQGTPPPRLRSVAATLQHADSPDSSLRLSLEIRRQHPPGDAPSTTSRRLQVIYEAAGPGLNR